MWGDCGRKVGERQGHGLSHTGSPYHGNGRRPETAAPSQWRLLRAVLQYGIITGGLGRMLDLTECGFALFDSKADIKMVV